MLSNTVGRPVQGPDFFDRVSETARLWSRLETDSVLLLAPRRVGKTSLMYRLCEDAPAHNFHAAYLSVSDSATEYAFVEKLYAEAQKSSAGRKAVQSLRKSPVGQFLRRIKKLGLLSVSIELTDTGQEQWAQLGEALAQALDKVDGRWLLLVDELPIFVTSLLRLDPTTNRARIFLNWFRQLRLSSRTVRWVLAGSIGLDTVTRRIKLGDTINDLFLFNDFGAFAPNVADALLQELARNYELPFPEGVRTRIIKRIEWLIPYHLQLFFSELRSHCSDHRLAPSVETVDAVYEALLTPGKRAYFDYWEQRLRDELGPPDDRQAIVLLNAIARNPIGEPTRILHAVLGKHIQEPDARSEKLRYLLDVLQSDGYLAQEGDRMRFRSSLLRDFWVRRVSA